MTAHAHGGGPSLDVVLVLLAVLAVVVYVAGVAASARRGRTWPVHRTVLWCTGVLAGLAAVAGPLAAAAHESFVAHMQAHLLVGMIAPLLLVLAAPGTLALRTLALTPARRLSRLLRSAPVRVVSSPLVAGMLSAGGLWLLYATPLSAAMRTEPLLHVLVHGHLLLAGFLFTTAVLGVDPTPHPPNRYLVAVVLVLTMASHAILAKHLYAGGADGFATADVQAGAQLMYYAGAWVEAVVVVLFCARWYRAGARRAALVPAS